MEFEGIIIIERSQIEKDKSYTYMQNSKRAEFVKVVEWWLPGPEGDWNVV